MKRGTKTKKETNIQNFEQGYNLLIHSKSRTRPDQTKPKLKCHQNLNVTKTEMSPKLKCHKTEILLKLICH